MHYTSSLRRQARSVLAALLVLFCAAEAQGFDSYSNIAVPSTLTIPSLGIGSATYSTVVIPGITIGDVIGINNNGIPAGSEDTYTPSSQHLFIPSVTVDSAASYTNVTVNVGPLPAPYSTRVTFESVSGADTYGHSSAYPSHGAVLSIPIVEITTGALAGRTFCNVVATPNVTPGAYTVSMGMPQVAEDQYNPATGVLSIPAVTLLANNAVYTNVMVTVTLADVLAYSSCGGSGSSSSSSSSGSSGGGTSSGSSGSSGGGTSSSGSSSSGGGTSSSSGSSGGGTSSGSSGSTSGGGFWVPFGEKDTTTRATIGFGVLPSNLSTGTITQVSTTGTEVALTEVYSISASGSTETGLTPYAAVYAAQSGGNFQLYYALLTNTSATPVPTRFSSFSVPGTDTVCSASSAGYANITNPMSFYLIVTVFTAAEISADQFACSDDNATGTSYLVHLSDSTSTPAVQLTTVQGNLSVTEMFNGSGTISGLLAFDNSNNLNFYPAASGLPSFASPTTIVSNVQVQPNQPIFTTISSNRAGQFLAGGTQAFVALTPTATAPTQQFWHILFNGTATDVYPSAYAIFDSRVYDNTNYYFEATPSSQTSNYNYYSVSLATGTLSTVYSGTVNNTLVDSDGTRLFLTGTSGGEPAVLTLPVSAASGFAVLVSNATATGVDATLSFASDQLFVNFRSVSGYTGEVVTGAGTIKAGPTVGTEYLGLSIDLGGSFGNNILQLNPVTSELDDGGANLSNITISTLQSTPVKDNGSNYQVPASFFFEGVQGATSLVAGVGADTGTGAEFGFLVDLSSSQMITTPVSSTVTLSPFF